VGGGCSVKFRPDDRPFEQRLLARELTTNNGPAWYEDQSPVVLYGLLSSKPVCGNRGRAVRFSRTPPRLEAGIEAEGFISGRRCRVAGFRIPHLGAEIAEGDAAHDDQFQPSPPRRNIAFVPCSWLTGRATFHAVSLLRQYTLQSCQSGRTSPQMESRDSQMVARKTFFITKAAPESIGIAIPVSH